MTRKLAVFDASSPLGVDPWVTDGTAAGTFLLKDVNTGTRYDSNVTLGGFAALGADRAIFVGQSKTDTANLGVYVTDGTAAGTTLLKTVGLFPYKNVQLVTLNNGTVLFQSATLSAAAGSPGVAADETDLWTTDGTVAGTVKVKTIAYAGSPYAKNLTALGNGKAVFTVPTATATQLWVTDGTAAGTVVLPTAPTNGYGPIQITPLGNGSALFLGARNATDYTGALWTTDGTAAGTVKLGDLNFRTPASIGNNKVVFYADGGLTSKNGLYVSDGTVAGTILISPIDYYYFTPVTSIGNGRAVFARLTDKYATGQPTAAQIYVTDGTTAGTTLVKSVPNASDGVLPTGFTGLGNGKFLFSLSTAARGPELWVSDGTSAGTLQITDLLPGTNGSTPLNITSIGDGYAVLVATQVDSNNNGPGAELFITDGTAAGTSLVKDIYPGIISSGATNFLTLSPVVATPFAFTIAPLDASKADGTGNQTPYTFTVTRTGDLSQATSVAWSAAGSGTNPAPPGLIVNPAGTVSFAAGAATATITVNLQGAQIVSTETFAVTLGGAPAGSAAATATGTILPTPPDYNLDPLFDALFYLAHNPDVAASKLNAYLHYLLQGFKEGRDPSALFSTSYYLSHNPDVAASGVNPLLQFEQTGFRQGRDPSAGFSVANYLAANPDVKAAGLNALLHYVTSGKAEGRMAFAPSTAPADTGVDASAYYTANPDVRAAGVDAATHYHASGWHEGRNPSALFDTNFYLAQNPDVKAAGIDPLLHFETVGWKEGRDPSLLFSDAKYLAANPDVKAAGVNPLLHYLTSGQAEGRAAFIGGGTAAADPLVDAAFYDKQLGSTLVPGGAAAAQQAAASYDATGWQHGLNPDRLFDTAYYLSHNPDVAAAHINPLLHFEANGWKEGRDPSAAFSTKKYLAAYSDVKAAGIDPLLHYVQSGQAEGRTAFVA